MITDPKTKPVEKVGVNFGTPHRDITYSNCHGAEDGKPDILSLWIPVVPVSTENGCMYVIPRENDPQFDKDVAKKDQVHTSYLTLLTLSTQSHQSINKPPPPSRIPLVIVFRTKM